MQSFAVYNRDNIIRKKSSSGGAFYALGLKVIEAGGVVCGASFGHNFSVQHSFAFTKEDLERMIGSKYVQSDLKGVFQNIKEFLNEGKLVMFSGTPCQVAGLKNYIGENPKLITVDFVCHGVPSPKIWRAYIDELQRKNRLEKVNFRDKHFGWKNFTLTFKYENGKYVANKRWAEPYMKCFLRDLDLRPSCYECKSKGVDRPSDLTLADLWGADDIDKELNGDEGITLVVVHSEKGKRILDSAADLLISKEIALEAALKHNRYMTTSVKKNEARSNFMNHIDTNSVIKYMEKSTPVSLSQIIDMKRKELKIGTRIRKFFGK